MYVFLRFSTFFSVFPRFPAFYLTYSDSCVRYLAYLLCSCASLTAYALSISFFFCFSSPAPRAHPFSLLPRGFRSYPQRRRGQLGILSLCEPPHTRKLGCASEKGTPRVASFHSSPFSAQAFCLAATIFPVSRAPPSRRMHLNYSKLANAKRVHGLRRPLRFRILRGRR